MSVIIDRTYSTSIESRKFRPVPFLLDKILLYTEIYISWPKSDMLECKARKEIMDAPFDLFFWLSSLMELSGLMTAQRPDSFSDWSLVWSCPIELPSVEFYTKLSQHVVLCIMCAAINVVKSEIISIFRAVQVKWDWGIVHFSWNNPKVEGKGITSQQRSDYKWGNIESWMIISLVYFRHGKQHPDEVPETRPAEVWGHFGSFLSCPAPSHHQHCPGISQHAREASKHSPGRGEFSFSSFGKDCGQA